MNRRSVFIAGIIGLVFGILFSGTLGLDFFNSNEPTNTPEVTLNKDAEAFILAYNLTESIYEPIFGEEVYDKIENGETFILYVGRDTCAYCQQFVPVLQEAAMNQDYTEIYHVDSIDPANEQFIETENLIYTPTTFLFKDGEVVDVIIGFHNLDDTEQSLIDNLS